ncbi:hypothetical protein ABZ746_36995 [Streptomyces sp. NPDC020096]
MGRDTDAECEAAATTLLPTVALRGWAAVTEAEAEAALPACVEQALRWKERTG